MHCFVADKKTSHKNTLLGNNLANLARFSLSHNTHLQLIFFSPFLPYFLFFLSVYIRIRRFGFYCPRAGLLIFKGVIRCGIFLKGVLYG
jgi:hypothetical protein